MSGGRRFKAAAGLILSVLVSGGVFDYVEAPLLVLRIKPQLAISKTVVLIAKDPQALLKQSSFKLVGRD